MNNPIVSLGTFAVPAYALAYLVNGDASGLAADDVRMIDEWLAAEFPGHDRLTFSPDGSPEFTSNPVFGLACECEQTEIHGHLKECPPEPEAPTLAQMLQGAAVLLKGCPYQQSSIVNARKLIEAALALASVPAQPFTAAQVEQVLDGRLGVGMTQPVPANALTNSMLGAYLDLLRGSPAKAAPDPRDEYARTLAAEQWGTDGEDVQLGGLGSAEPAVSWPEDQDADYCWVQGWLRVDVPQGDAQ